MKKIAIVLTFLFTVSLIHSQKMKIEEGNFDFIKDQKEINVEFVYDNMTLMKEKMTNDEYVEKRSADLEEKSRGKGEVWKKK
ncbi:hypothetical protein UMM65_01485 [Aureibaculum sp. 2210JD6-5]|uniref:hypothetical protein n=1 Tax=Aureibaculum sp. 2210JD6-5 TaxID=3103957 RepID=UPI002AAE3079|nr:hypothetical protein [Aureibaculum sp. 2210JD6-5]MDY7393904.1 hypothetical protein [Aureibaculum sp. 2210JD6-5]